MRYRVGSLNQWSNAMTQDEAILKIMGNLSGSIGWGLIGGTVLGVVIVGVLHLTHPNQASQADPQHYREVHAVCQLAAQGTLVCHQHVWEDSIE